MKTIFILILLYSVIYFFNQLYFNLLRSICRKHLVIVVRIKEHIIDVLLSGGTGNDSATAFTIHCIVSKIYNNLLFRQSINCKIFNKQLLHVKRFAWPNNFFQDKEKRTKK